jgi:hypothetical protein
MHKRQIFGLVSSIVLFLGSFFPIVQFSSAFGGSNSVSYFDVKDSYGKLIVLYAIAGIVLAAVRHERWVIIPAGLAILQLAYALYDYNNQLNAVTSNAFANLFLQAAVKLQLSPIGWVLMFAGAIGLALTPYLPFNGTTTHRVPKGKSSRDDLDLFI